MEHALPAALASANPTASPTANPTAGPAAHDHILAAFLESGALPEVARRVNMSLASLAAWAAKHTDLIDNVHKLLLARCKLIAAQLELNALTALAAVSSAATSTDDARLRERSLERQRKAASAILRHNTQRTPRASTANSERKPGAPCAPPHASDPHVPTAISSLAAAVASDRSWPHAAPSSRSEPTPKLSPAQRFAARRLAALQAS